MGNYIWELKAWPTFTWDSEKVLPLLGQARKEQGSIIGQASLLGLEDIASFTIEEALKTSSIEGELLNKDSVRSSVARRLGLPTQGLPASQRLIEGLVEMLFDANKNYTSNLTMERLYSWHAALFPTGYSGLIKINVGGWRNTKEPMQVISGAVGKKVVHYEAPPSKKVNMEMKVFLNWWNIPPQKLDGLLRAALAHLWFLTIHPFEDGNGRIARAITEMALAQDEQIDTRYYSLSSQIESQKESYYEILENTQKGDLDITDWIKWFLETYTQALKNSYTVINKALYISKFWQQANMINLNERQKKVLSKLLEAEPEGFEGGITNRKYVSIAKTSKETAKRDLVDLEYKKLIARGEAKGRSLSYSLVLRMKK
ncbi:MAG: Fic family protein [Bdellovibrionaceae bacterium]|nr:Fic family protein [Pseudobdellovibrionaceae bacterium]